MISFFNWELPLPGRPLIHRLRQLRRRPVRPGPAQVGVDHDPADGGGGPGQPGPRPGPRPAAGPPLQGPGRGHTPADRPVPGGPGGGGPALEARPLQPEVRPAQRPAALRRAARQPDWVSNTPLLAVEASLVWRWTPFMMLILLAGL
ncbi:hypothetical protein LV779_32615 [Streptomyces thinghirensis]|nr:hypothetical protein [Streptomyces thinghirensis]